MPYKETAPFSLTLRFRPLLSLFLSCAFSARSRSNSAFKSESLITVLSLSRMFPPVRFSRCLRLIQPGSAGQETSGRREVHSVSETAKFLPALSPVALRQFVSRLHGLAASFIEQAQCPCRKSPARLFAVSHPFLVFQMRQLFSDRHIDELIQRDALLPRKHLRGSTHRRHEPQRKLWDRSLARFSRHLSSPPSFSLTVLPGKAPEFQTSSLPQQNASCCS